MTHKRILSLSLRVSAIAGTAYTNKDFNKTPDTLYTNGNLITIGDRYQVRSRYACKK